MLVRHHTVRAADLCHDGLPPRDGRLPDDDGPQNLLFARTCVVVCACVNGRNLVSGTHCVAGLDVQHEADGQIDDIFLCSTPCAEVHGSQPNAFRIDARDKSTARRIDGQPDRGLWQNLGPVDECGVTSLRPDDIGKAL